MISLLTHSTPRPASSPAVKPLDMPELQRSSSLGSPAPPALDKPTVSILTPPKPPSPPRTASSCGHPNAGQELCYLCHQRERRNVPVSFNEERKRREQEEDQLLQHYQHVKDNEDILQEQVRGHARGRVRGHVKVMW